MVKAKEILSLSNPLVLHFLKLKSDRKYRHEMKTVLIEGKNVISDLAKKKKVKRVIIEAYKNLPKDIVADEIIQVSPAILKKISSVITSDGLVAEVFLPESHLLENEEFVVVLDRIQDPGNLGTIIRTACAFGWQAIFLIEPSCDPFNDKALRAAKGASFDIPIQTGSWDDLKAFLGKRNLQVVVADLQGKAPEKIKSKSGILLILGNEAHGALLPDSFSHEKVTLEMSGAIESLNVAQAGAVLMYVLKR